MCLQRPPRRLKIFPTACRSAACPLVVTMRERREHPMIEFKPRFFVLPAIAITVLAMLHAPADGGRSAQGECGPVGRSGDPGIQARFLAATRRQSHTAEGI